MKRALAVCLFSSAASLLFTVAHPAQAQTVDTQVTLSCNDGHSVTAAVDSTTLLQWQAAVQALIDAGLSCTLDPAATPPMSWTVYDYNPSDQAIAPRGCAASMPATTMGNTTSFPFKSEIYTALLTTTDSGLTGDLSMTTLNVTVSVSGGNRVFEDQHNGGCLPDRKSVRFYFASPKASGTTCAGTTGFYTQFWWSNPMSVTLATDPQTTPMAISQAVNAPSMWPDWNGKLGDGSNSCPQTAEAFQDAIHNVQTVGLSSIVLSFRKVARSRRSAILDLRIRGLLAPELPLRGVIRRSRFCAISYHPLLVAGSSIDRFAVARRTS